LGVHYSLVWDGVLQHGWGWLLHILLWGLLGGRRCRGTWSTYRFFHPFKVDDLGEMVSIVTKLTTKGTREVGPKIVVIFPLAFIIAPLRVLVPCVLVAPSRLVLLGLVLVSSWSRIIIVQFFPFFLALFD
jgi:hypothetical protein